jgi:nucleotide-binding universal stress UspA family protein
LLEHSGSIIVYKHLLIASDGSELAQKAVDQGLALAKTLNAKASAVNVTEPWTAVAPGEVAIAFPLDEYEKGAAANATKILKGIADAAEKAGVACETVHVKDQFPAEGIIETAKARGCDLIVMASHGRRGLMRLVLGSQANRVVANSVVPVLVCR